MKRMVIIMTLALMLAGCWQFLPKPWAHGYDVPWFARPFLYCFISSAGR